MEAMSDVLDTDDTIMKKAQKEKNSASKMADQISKISEKMAETVTKDKSISVSTPNIAALIMKVSNFLWIV